MPSLTCGLFSSKGPPGVLELLSTLRSLSSTAEAKVAAVKSLSKYAPSWNGDPAERKRQGAKAVIYVACCCRCAVNDSNCSAMRDENAVATLVELLDVTHDGPLPAAANRRANEWGVHIFGPFRLQLLTPHYRAQVGISRRRKRTLRFRRPWPSVTSHLTGS